MFPGMKDTNAQDTNEAACKIIHGGISGFI